MAGERGKLIIPGQVDNREMSAEEVAQVVEVSPPNDFLERSSERGEKVGTPQPAGAGKLIVVKFDSSSAKERHVSPNLVGAQRLRRRGRRFRSLPNQGQDNSLRTRPPWALSSSLRSIETTRFGIRSTAERVEICSSLCLAV
jgi:hypothetical protein